MKEKSAHSRHFILMDDLALRSPGLTQQLDLSHSFLPGSSLTAPVQAPVLFARIVAIASSRARRTYDVCSVSPGPTSGSASLPPA